MPTLLFIGCNNGSRNEKASESVQIDFLYASEKEGWIRNVTGPFNGAGYKTASGRRIFVRAIPMGSDELMNSVLSGERQAQLLSPASIAYIKLANAQSRTQTGKDLITSTETLARSPVVIAMWKPMAEALGWGKRPIGWAEIVEMARSHRNWQSYRLPSWGPFTLGHTNPAYNNSGLLAAIAAASAAPGNNAALTPNDLSRPQTARFLRDLESAAVLYGNSTTFFQNQLFGNPPQFLSAAVLYEHLLVESYSEAKPATPIVAIYPKEGTFWSDHPVGIVERDWVTPEHREAAKIYVHYLLDEAQQRKAMEYGFRPADSTLPLAAPLDPAHGIDPQEPKAILEVPSAEVVEGTIKLWRANKKPAEIAVIAGISGPGTEMRNLRIGLHQMIAMLDDKDELSLASQSLQTVKAYSLKGYRQQLNSEIDSLSPREGLPIYSMIADSYQRLSHANANRSKIAAILVIADREDTHSRIKLDDLLTQVRFNGSSRNTRIFTIAYGEDAPRGVFKEISRASQAKSYDATPKNILEVLRDVGTHF